MHVSPSDPDDWFWVIFFMTDNVCLKGHMVEQLNS